MRTSSPLAVALLDLDRFKQINDTYGHLIGDEVLRHVADTMTGLLRDYDLAGRFGGEEFVMLLPQTRAPDAFKIADRVRAHIARLPIATSGGEPVRVTVSIGVAALDAGSSRELTELLAAADAALYRAKASGRNQVQMISTSRGLSAVRSPADDEPVPAAVGGGFRGPARCRPRPRSTRRTRPAAVRRSRVRRGFRRGEFGERVCGRRVSGAGRRHREHRDHLGLRGVTLRCVTGLQCLRGGVALAVQPSTATGAPPPLPRMSPCLIMAA